MKGTCVHKACTGLYSFLIEKGFLDNSVGKEFACNAGDPGLTPGSGKSAGMGIDYHSSILGLPLWLSW